MDLKIEYEGVYWIQLAQDMVLCATYYEQSNETSGIIQGGHSSSSKTLCYQFMSDSTFYNFIRINIFLGL
jgi:hypothetical protein